MPDDYVSANDTRFLQQLTVFETKLPLFADAFGLTPAQVASVTADKNYFAYLTACLEILRNTGAGWTAQRDLTLHGPK